MTLGALILASCATLPNRVEGSCSDGSPHGAYALFAGDGHLMVQGTFQHGKKDGRFEFWSRKARKLAEIPYRADRKHGLVRIWYFDGPKKLEARYAKNHLSGTKRSWFPNGQLRSTYEYEHDRPITTSAWDASGNPLPPRKAADRARFDVIADDKLYAALERAILEHPPACSPGEPSGGAH